MPTPSSSIGEWQRQFFRPATNANLKMSQDSVGIAIGWIL
jgi:hypothetical protein